MNPKLPTRRRHVIGQDLEGRNIELRLSISRKLYRCPGCGGSLEIGSEHVLVMFTDAGYHQHWHNDCAADRVVRNLRRTRTEPA